MKDIKKLLFFHFFYKKFLNIVYKSIFVEHPLIFLILYLMLLINEINGQSKLFFG